MTALRLLPAAALPLVCASAFAAVEYTGKNFPDPFSDGPSTAAGAAEAEKQAAEAVAQLSSLTVEGVVLSPDGNLAIIRGSVVRVGDTLVGYKIYSIDPDGVVLAGNAGGQAKFYKLKHKG